MYIENLTTLTELTQQLGFDDPFQFPNNALHLSNLRAGNFTLEVDDYFDVCCPIHSTLYFERVGTTDRYLFQSFASAITLNHKKMTVRKHRFKAETKGITHREAYNLLCGRAVYKQWATHEGEKKNMWIEFNFDLPPLPTGYRIHRYSASTFDVALALNRLPLVEHQNRSERQAIVKWLKEGTACLVSFIKPGRTEPKMIEACPRLKCIVIRPLPLDPKHIGQVKSPPLPLAGIPCYTK